MQPVRQGKANRLHQLPGFFTSSENSPGLQSCVCPGPKTFLSPGGTVEIAQDFSPGPSRVKIPLESRSSARSCETGCRFGCRNPVIGRYFPGSTLVSESGPGLSGTGKAPERRIFTRLSTSSLVKLPLI